ncbi:hypothetical protein ADUPG1_006329, partial [Aduncisulcus paluster]
NMAEHTADGRAESGFAFLGDGLMQCSHGHCQHLSTPGFKQMMLDQFDEWAKGRRALGLDVPLGAKDGRHFLTLTDLKAQGALGGDGIEAALSEAEGVAQRQADAQAEKEQTFEDGLAALAYRFVWVQSQNLFVDTKLREFVTTVGLGQHKDVVKLIPAGTTGKKAAANVLLNRDDRGDALGLVYRPGDNSVLVEAVNGQGFVGPHVNMWVPGNIGRRPGNPSKWLEVVEHVVPDTDFREWLLNWLAWVLQNPSQRTPVIPFIVSGQGTGKDTFLAPVLRILGEQNVTKVNQEEFASPFNEWVRRRFLHLDEVKLDAGGRAYNKIKSLTGTGAGCMVTIDSVWALDDFEALNKIEEVERIHDFLMSRDLTGFNAHTPPEDTTGSKADVIAAALPEGARAAFALVASGAMKDRVLFTTQEVVEALQGHPNPNVRNHLTANIVARGIQVAGCIQASNGLQVRIDGQRQRLWVGVNVDMKERARLAGRGVTAPPSMVELRDLYAADLKAEAERAAKAVEDALGVAQKPQLAALSNGSGPRPGVAAVGHDAPSPDQFKAQHLERRQPVRLAERAAKAVEDALGVGA